MKVKIENLDEATSSKLIKTFQAKTGFVKVEDNIILPQKYSEIAESIKNLKIRESDVFLCSYPRTGSTWAQEMVWLLGNDLNYETAMNNLQQTRTPLLELSAIFSEDHTEWLNESIGNSVDCVDKMQGRRFVKCHLPWKLLPDELDTVRPKIIYTARNPKDLCVSYFYYCSLVHQLNCTLDEFCELFLNDLLPIGPAGDHMVEFWKRRDQGNILFIKYEDMKRDLPKIIRKCADFLEIERTLTETDIDRMCEHLKFSRMQKNPAVNLEPILFKDKTLDEKSAGMYEKVKFIRKGQIGDWKNQMSAEMSRKFDDWAKRKFESVGLEFDYE